MNACVRAIVKAAPSDVTIVGVRNGGLGLLRDQPGGDRSDPDYFDMGPADVANILHRSGTILRSARDIRFRQFVEEQLPTGAADDVPDVTRHDRLGKAVGELAVKSLDSNRIDGLVLIGGDTTCRAARYIYEASGAKIPILVVPATIDNDIAGTVQTIGFDSALAMAVLQVDSIRETAAAMDRLFLVEVMGREQGHLAVELSLATGAEAVLIPEQAYSEAYLKRLADRLAERIRWSGGSALVIVAEGARVASATTSASGVPSSAAHAFATYFEGRNDGPEVRVTILGHTLRGAPPTPFTRNLATRSGLFVLDELQRQIKNPSRHRPPTLVGMHHEGFLDEIPIEGDMVRRDTTRLLAVVREQIDVLSGEGVPRT